MIEKMCVLTNCDWNLCNKSKIKLKVLIKDLGCLSYCIGLTFTKKDAGF